MAGFGDYSTTPGLNVTIGGVSSAEGCPPGNINNICRQLAADGRMLWDAVQGIGGGMPTSGGTFTGDIIDQGFGGYYSANDSGSLRPRIYVLADGSPAPSTPPNGSLVFYYAP
jgi:hypothetical protein